jgi:hypothetical protein
MHKPIYNSKSWVLCQCTECGRLNYVEPHGTTAKCKCSDYDTKHQPVPQDCCDFGRQFVIRKPALVEV